MKLNVGGAGARQDAREQPALVDPDAERPPPVHQPFQADAGLPCEGAQIIVRGDRFRDAIHQPELQMVLQVLAHARQIVNDVDTVTPQQITGTDARELQQLRALQRARRQDHFARRPHFADRAVLPEAHAGRPASLHDEAGGLRIGFGLQIGPAFRRLEVSDRRTVAPAVAREQLKVADAFLIAAVEVVGPWHTQLLGAANDGLHQFALLLDIGGPQRSVAAVASACAAAVVFRLDEIRQHAIPVPPGIARAEPPKWSGKCRRAGRRIGIGSGR